MECIICDNKFEKNILFENEQIIIMLAVEPAVSGQIQIFSKQHHTIMEQATDEEISAMISAANKISIVLFELLKVHGTNIIINNGVPAGQKIPHFSIDILPRRTDDNLKLDWALKQAAPEALDSIQRIINEGMNTPEKAIMEEKRDVGIVEAKSKRIEIIKKDAKKTEEDSDDENQTNYYHQLFKRVP
jgi:diadenosine tetraphosphate (Ap4A) HIT family hydrolase